MNIWRVLGVIGMLLVSTGILQRQNKRNRNILFLFGGLLLLCYSIYLRDILFIVLQLVFSGAAVYELITTKK